MHKPTASGMKPEYSPDIGQGACSTRSTPKKPQKKRSRDCGTSTKDAREDNYSGFSWLNLSSCEKEQNETTHSHGPVAHLSKPTDTIRSASQRSILSEKPRLVACSTYVLVSSMRRVQSSNLGKDWR